jgi:hypothetical protein
VIRKMPQDSSKFSREAQHFSGMSSKARTYCSLDACWNVASFADRGVESWRHAVMIRELEDAVPIQLQSQYCCQTRLSGSTAG